MEKLIKRLSSKVTLPPNVPVKGWNVLFRLYGPLEPWFDQSWKLSDPKIIK